MSLNKIFLINLAIGALVCLAHIPLVLLKLNDVTGFQEVKLWQIIPLIPLDLILFLGAIVALVGSEHRKGRILPIHAVVLALFAFIIIGMIFWFILIGLPKGSFSWTPGLGAAFVGYTVYALKLAFYQQFPLKR